jgi:hypothetical protein
VNRDGAQKSCAWFLESLVSCAAKNANLLVVSHFFEARFLAFRFVFGGSPDALAARD